MKGIDVTELSSNRQVLASQGREALAGGETYEALTCLSQLVAEVPACLDLRKLLRRAQYTHYGPATNQAVTPHQWWPATATLSLQQPSLNPYKGLVIAERWLGRNPYNVTAHRRLAQNASVLGLRKTVVFAHECILRYQPNNSNRMDLAQACLDADDPKAAIATAEVILREDSRNQQAIELIKRSSLIASLEP